MTRFGGKLIVAAVLVASAASAGGATGQTATKDASRTEPSGPAPTVPVPTRDKVEHTTLDLVDTSRSTPAEAGQPASDQRELATDVYIPAGTGPFPLIAFSHGFDGHPNKFTELFETWAEAGYAVVAPAFPRSNSEAPGGPTVSDGGNQPGDVSFVIDHVLAASADERDPLYGSVDPDHIGVGGLSLGGLTTYNVAFNECCRDDRISAALVLDGVAPNIPLDSGLPLMIIHADRDPVLPHAMAAQSYAAAVAPKWFVTLHEMIHHQPFEDIADPADDLVEDVTTAFWDRWLKGDEGAVDRIAEAVTPATLAELEFETG